MTASLAPGRLTVGSVAAATAGRVLAGSPETEMAGVSIDSRSLRTGELFVAIKGPRFDGHDFLAEAAARGASAVLIHREIETPGSLCAILVADTAAALMDLGRAMRRAAKLPVVAITGSMGKTTTKEMAAQLLATKGPVLKTEGNLNNRFGVPLSLLRLQPEHTAAVLELGMSAAGELSMLSRTARPDVAVITNVAPVHLEFFSSLDAIARAKAEILEGLGEDGVAVLNADDRHLRTIGEGFRGPIVWFGRDPLAEISVGRWRGNGSGMRFDLSIEGRTLEIHLPLTGPHFIDNFLAAAAAAYILGVPLESLALTAASMQAAAHRGRVLRLRNGVSLLDDCYNANPEATKAAVKALTLLRGRRRVAFLGDMLELGPSGPELHRQVGRAVAPHLDCLVAVGPEAAQVLDGARSGGLTAESLIAFPDALSAAEAAASLLTAGDAVLVKGSRGLRMEEVVETLVTRLGIEEG